MTATGIGPTTTLFVNEHSTVWPNWLNGYVEKQLDKKVTAHSKIDWTNMIKIHILPNISRSKDNQATKFGQLIEYSVSNIFLQK